MIVRRTSEIYLDSNATTPVLPAAAKAAHEAMEELFGNPSSSHTSGLRARFLLESTRDMARTVLGTAAGQIVFTSGATEAIQMGVFSTLCHVREQRAGQKVDPNKPTRKILYSATEHKAVPQAIKHWNRLLGVNDEVLAIPVNRLGQLDLEFLAQHAADADLICTMAVNNESGVITDLDAVEKVIRDANPTVAWLVDCVQAVGKVALELAQTTIDYAPISGHKVYAPKGIGLLYVREGAPLVPLMAGGGQEQGARGGTENLPGVAAFAAVLEKLVASPTRVFENVETLNRYRDKLIASLRQAFPTIVFNTPLTASVPTTINFSVKGFPSKELLDLFDAAGIRVSSGSACGSAVQGSYVLEAMGLERWRSDGAVRMSFGPLTSAAEIDAACERIQQAGEALCDSCLVLTNDQDGTSGQELDGLIQLKSGSMCTWLLMDSASKRCVIIDPFEELAGRVETLVRCQKSQVVAILDTHAHVDHDSCRAMLLKVLGDLVLSSAHTADELGWPETSDGEIELGDGSQAEFLRLSNKRKLIQTSLPGHTQIGRAFLVSSGNDLLSCPGDIEFAFTGDMILMGGIGRTDFPSSTIAGMYDSLRRLPMLISDATVICPTHDYNTEFCTTLAAERGTNPFLDGVINGKVSLSEFLEQKPVIDAKITDATNSELVCGLIKGCASDASSIEIAPHELRDFFADHADSLILDVREPHEFSFAQDWSDFGFDSPPENVPLTRLSGYLPRLLKRFADSQQDVIFLCRSGKRSGKAAEIARRVGLTTARHIAGGIALTVKTTCVSKELAEPSYMI